MKLRIKRISIKSFVLIFSIINGIAGFFLGGLVTIASLTAPQDQSLGGAGAWAIIIFPFLKAALAAISGSFLIGMYNFLVDFFGGILIEFEEERG